MKPLLHRRTFWKGVATGAAAMAALITGSVVAVSLLAPKELSRGVRPTWEPAQHYAGTGRHAPSIMPPCDTRGKDCVVFDEPATIKFEVPIWTPFEAPTRNVTEPSSLWLLVAAAAACARNTLFAAVMVAFDTLGRWLGMREEDE